MANDPYISTIGVIQHFPDQPVYVQKDVGDSVVTEFTIRTVTKQSLVRVSIWDEFGQETIDKLVAGALVSADGPFKTNQGTNGTTYNNLTARTLTIMAPEPKTAREVVNGTPKAQAADSGSEDSPF